MIPVASSAASAGCLIQQTSVLCSGQDRRQPRSRPLGLGWHQSRSTRASIRLYGKQVPEDMGNISEGLTSVLAAVVQRDDRYLICQHPAHKRHRGLWEFPGGKLEPGETHDHAAHRELAEELDVDVRTVLSPGATGHMTIPPPN